MMCTSGSEYGEGGGEKGEGEGGGEVNNEVIVAARRRQARVKSTKNFEIFYL